jgi:hypothetical protein
MPDVTETASPLGEPSPSSLSGSSQGWGTQAARLMTVVAATVLRWKDCLSEEWTVVVMVAPWCGVAVNWIAQKVKGR